MKLDELASLMKLVVFSLPPRTDQEGPDPSVRHEESLIYGQAGGADLLLDVFTPRENPNGKGLIFIISGGFFSNARILKLSEPLAERLARDYGYTVFAVTHGSQPRHIIAEIIPQIARAVRFIRHHAGRFGIDPAALGIMGFSSGGLLAVMAGVRGDDGHPAAADPIERTPSRVQAVVGFFPPTDFLNYGGPNTIDLGQGVLRPLRESFIHKNNPPDDERAMGRRISPRYHVTPDAAPTLLIHGDQDQLVPLQQSQTFLESMLRLGAACELRVKEGAGHGWTDIDPEIDAAIEWFDTHLGVEKVMKVNS